MDATFLQDRITATKASIIAYEAAILALASGVQSYQLDTGQTDQRVTKLDLDSLRRVVNSLYNTCATLEARRTGCNSFHVRPIW